MSTRSYVLTGAHASPEKFVEYLKETAFYGQALRLTAKRTDSDELSVRRGDQNEELEFRLHVENLNGLGCKPWLLDGIPYGLGDTIRWLQLEVKEDSVEFDILS